MARASRELAITHLAQHAAQRLLGDDDAEFLENPLAEIDDPPAHDPVIAGIGPLSMIAASAARCTSFNRGGCPGALRSIRPSGPCALNLTTQSRTTCSPTPADLRRLSARGAVVNRRKSQQPARLRPVLRPFRRRPQPARAIIIPKTNCCRHGEPPAVRPGRTNFSRFGNPRREFASAGTGIS